MNTFSPVTPSLPLQNPQSTSSHFKLSAVVTPVIRSSTLPKAPPLEISKVSEKTLFDQKLHLLQSHGVEFTSSDLHRISGMCPDLLPANPNLLIASISFLLSNLNLSPSDLLPLFKRRPRLLLSCVKTRLRPSLFFLISLDLNPIEDYASFLCFSVEEKFLPRLDFLQQLGFSHKEARSMARRFPQLFCYSIEDNLRPKSQYLLEEMRRDLLELRSFPDYFGYSLERRIRPRHELCKKRGVKLSLPAMLKPGEIRFNSRLKEFGGSRPPVRESPLWSAGFS